REDWRKLCTIAHPHKTARGSSAAELSDRISLVEGAKVAASKAADHAIGVASHCPSCIGLQYRADVQPRKAAGDTTVADADRPGGEGLLDGAVAPSDETTSRRECPGHDHGPCCVGLEDVAGVQHPDEAATVAVGARSRDIAGCIRGCNVSRDVPAHEAAKVGPFHRGMCALDRAGCVGRRDVAAVLADQ